MYGTLVNVTWAIILLYQLLPAVLGATSDVILLLLHHYYVIIITITSLLCHYYYYYYYRKLMRAVKLILHNLQLHVHLTYQGFQEDFLPVLV